MHLELLTLLAASPLVVTFASDEARCRGFLIAGLCAALVVLLAILDLSGSGGLERLWLLALLGANGWLMTVGLGGCLS